MCITPVSITWTQTVQRYGIVIITATLEHAIYQRRIIQTLQSTASMDLTL